MPKEKTTERTQRGKKRRKSLTTQSGEFVREDAKPSRQGSSNSRSVATRQSKQAAKQRSAQEKSAATRTAARTKGAETRKARAQRDAQKRVRSRHGR